MLALIGLAIAGVGRIFAVLSFVWQLIRHWYKAGILQEALKLISHIGLLFICVGMLIFIIWLKISRKY